MLIPLFSVVLYKGFVWHNTHMNFFVAIIVVIVLFELCYEKTCL